jgi:hypothetical protein
VMSFFIRKNIYRISRRYRILVMTVITGTRTIAPGIKRKRYSAARGWCPRRGIIVRNKMSVPGIVNKSAVTGGTVTNIRIAERRISPLSRRREVMDRCCAVNLYMAPETVPRYRKFDTRRARIVRMAAFTTVKRIIYAVIVCVRVCR